MKFRKKPVVIEAKKFLNKNKQDILIWSAPYSREIDLGVGKIGLEIQTLEGAMLANINDWIIKGINGEFYPCKPDIFEKTYERVYDEEAWEN